MAACGLSTREGVADLLTYRAKAPCSRGATIVGGIMYMYTYMNGDRYGRNLFGYDA